MSAVIVTFAQRRLLARCLQSLRSELHLVNEPTEIIVVDNGGGDARDVVARFAPDARLIVARENLGFAGGAQLGIDRAAGEWILLVNDDTEVRVGAIAALLAAGRSGPRVGAVAAQLRFANAPETVNSAGIDVDCLGVAADRLVGRPAYEAGASVCEVFGASAAAALYRAEMLRDIGGFDTSFFAFLEDVDVAWRARMRGWSTLHAPSAIVLHEHSATAGHGSPFKWRLVGRNRMRLLAKNATTRQLVRHAIGIVLTDLSYVLFIAVRHRSAAPLRGRLEGLREWRAYRRAGAATRRPVALRPAMGPAAALRRNAAWRTVRRVAPLLQFRAACRNVRSELGHARRLSADRRSCFRWSSDIVAYRALRVSWVPGRGRPRTIRLRDGAELTYRLSRGDVLTLRDVWVDEVYELSPVSSVQTLVDLGASIGLSSVWIAQRYGCDHVVAVEPLPANVALLRRNLERNGIAAQVVQSAVGPVSGTAMFAPADEPSGGRLAADGIAVEVVAIADLIDMLRGDGVRLVKVDIDGAEADLFAGSPAWMSTVDAILVEIHDTVADADAIEDAIARAGLNPTTRPRRAAEGVVTSFIRQRRDA